LTNLLLITDIPRLRKIFSRLEDDKGITLRKVSSLEKGGEEIIAEKPAVIFVQTHLSGFSADILLMHLKKQLGRKRSRFVLLSAPSQVSADIIKLFNGHIDTSLDEPAMLAAIRSMLATPAARKKVVESEPVPPEVPQESERAPLVAQLARELPAHEPAEVSVPAVQAPAEPMQPEAGLPAVATPSETTAEQSLVEQGITYAPRSRVKVYSEFTSSFDSAVGNMLEEPEPPVEPPRTVSAWDLEHLETVEPSRKVSKRVTFLLWLAPVLIAVIVVTVLQQRKSTPKPIDVVSGDMQQKTKPENRPAVPSQPPHAGAPKAVTPVPSPVAKTTGEPGDKAMLSAIEENRGSKETTAPVQPGTGLTKLPDFIPRYGMEKAYGAANPGWERYKGQVTEFKVFHDKGSIKTIQVIDRGGNGVPESFMKAALRQVAKKPVFVLESSEKKEGYEIQRGHVDGNLKVVFYRDEQGGRLRAFAMSWQ
jgi:hypothetical protein